jgi:hypothetical protein
MDIKTVPRTALETSLKELANRYDVLLAKLIATYNNSKQNNRTSMIVKESEQLDCPPAYGDFVTALKARETDVQIEYDPDDDQDMGFHFCRPRYTITWK